jgi:GNAT superfamily N-acetyltransferase
MSLTTSSDQTVLTPAGLRIRDFDRSDADYATIVAIDNACFPEYPGTVDELRHGDTSRAAHIKHRRLIAESGGEPVGFGSYGQFEGMYHPRKFSLGLFVRPDHQGRGVGRALYEALLEALGPFEPLSLRANVREDQGRTLRFLTDRGFAEDMRSWESRLDVSAFDPAPFAGALERARQAGVTFATMAELMERDPDHRQKLYELDIEASLDEPHPEPITPVSRESYDGWVFNAPNYLPEGNFVAIDGGHYVGMSTLRSSLADPSELYVGFTGVRRSHRGKGIAMALKLLAIEFARGRGVRTIKTWNASNNRPMLRINEALGFAKQPAWVSFVKKLQDE